MRQLPPSRAAAGYTPNRLNPLALAPVADQGERLTDIQAIQRLFANGEQGGYWPADPVYLYEDSAGTTVASLNGVVGLRVNLVSGLPNASQATTANKPYLRRTPVSNQYWLDSNTSTGALTATFSGSLGSACTIATVGAEGVTIAENQTVGTSYNIAPAFNFDGDILIINRALTTVEKALVMRVLKRNVPTLGSELVTNGAFDTDLSGWTVRSGATATWNAGAVNTSSVSIANIMSQTVAATQNAYYLLGVDVLASSSGSSSLEFPSYIISSTVLGPRRYCVKAPTNGVALGFSAGSTGRTHTIDNISCKEIL